MHRLLIAITLAGCARAKPEPLQPPAIQSAFEPTEPPEQRRRSARMRRLPVFETAPQQKGDTRHLSPIAARLADLDSFTAGGNVMGEMQEPERLLIELAREPDALEMFAELAASPNRVARLYAYWALLSLDRPLADQLRADLVVDQTKVDTALGCIGMIRTTSAMAVDMDDWRAPGTGYRNITPAVTPTVAP